MTNNIFRPVEFWKSAIVKMPDTSFFELMRSVFGKIKTPFKKQQLIDDLETFLLREDIQNTIASYIEQNDAKIIAAVAVFVEPAPEELETFFEGELNYAQLQDLIVNLEERFILYRFNDENLHTGSPHFKGSALPKRCSRLALNPVLEQILLPFTTDVSLLFSETPVETDKNGSSSAPKIIVNDRILAGLFSFVSQNQMFYRTEGVIRKRIIEAWKMSFPGIDISFLLGGLQILGLFYVDKDSLLPDKKRFEDFASLSARERSEYCTAALLVYSELNSTIEILPPLYRYRIKEIANFIHCFLDSLEAGFLYSMQFLKRLLEIIKRKTQVTAESDKLLDVMEKTGILAAEGGQFKKISAVAENGQGAETEGTFIAIDSGSFVLVYPEINFADALSLAAAANIIEAGEVVKFEIDKDSTVRAFNNNISAEQIISLLKRLSCGRVDDALIWNLKDWEKRYSEVSLKKGVILTLAEDKRYLVKTVSLSGLVTETLAPGLYLLPEDAMDKAADALQSAGIDIIAHRKEKSSVGFSAVKYFYSLSSGYALPQISPPVSANNFSAITKGKESSKRKTANNAAALKAEVLTENFHAILKSLSIDETERMELSARIDRRLILCETQLKEANVRYEKLEARHMDYAGKQNIAKQAITQRSPVEIIWRSAGKEKSFLGIPLALEKEGAYSEGGVKPKAGASSKAGGELVLVIAPADSSPQDKDEIMRIPLAKISYIRRLKKSIFET